MKKGKFADAVKNGERVYGTLITSTSPKWLEKIKNTGIDFTFIDTEHIALGREQLSWMCQGYKALGLPPVVRIPAPDPYIASQVIDGGACGVLIPYVETFEQVKKLRGAVKQKPLKGHKLNKFLEGDGHFEKKLSSYLKQNNTDTMFMINIESRKGVKNLNNILQVPELDAVIIGPHDLSCSLGIPEQYDHPLFSDTVEEIIEKTKAEGISVGVHYSGGLEKMINREQAKKFNTIIYSSDISIFIDNLQKNLNSLKKDLGDEIINIKENINI